MGTDSSLAHLHSKAFRWNIPITCGVEKLEWRGYSMVKSLKIFLLVSTEYTNVMDSRMDRQTPYDGVGHAYA